MILFELMQASTPSTVQIAPSRTDDTSFSLNVACTRTAHQAVYRIPALQALAECIHQLYPDDYIHGVSCNSGHSDRSWSPLRCGTITHQFVPVLSFHCSDQ